MHAPTDTVREAVTFCLVCCALAAARHSQQQQQQEVRSSNDLEAKRRYNCAVSALLRCQNLSSCVQCADAALRSCGTGALAVFQSGVCDPDVPQLGKWKLTQGFSGGILGCLLEQLTGCRGQVAWLQPREDALSALCQACVQAGFDSCGTAAGDAVHNGLCGPPEQR